MSVPIFLIAGDVNGDLRIKLADARNTSLQVKEFSLEDLKQNFDWLKDVLEDSELRGRIRYRENEPKPVDIRNVLALLTLFHPFWKKKETDPVVAYTGKGVVIEMYKKKEWLDGYKRLAPIVVNILNLYDYMHVKFPEQYAKTRDKAAIGKRKEVRYIKSPEKAKELPLTHGKTQYIIPDGWLYPLLGSFRVLTTLHRKDKGLAGWITDPFKFFDEFGSQLIPTIVESSVELGSNPNAVGKSRRVWEALRDKVENRLLHLGQMKPEA